MAFFFKNKFEVDPELSMNNQLTPEQPFQNMNYLQPQQPSVLSGIGLNQEQNIPAQDANLSGIGLRDNPWASGGQKMLGNMSVNQFAEMAGRTAQAFDPNGFGGKLGGMAADMASRNEMLRNQYDIKKQEADEQRAWKTKEYDLLKKEKSMEKAMSFLANKNVHPSIRPQFAKIFATNWNALNPEMKISEESLLKDNTGEIMTQVKSITNDKELPSDVKKQSVAALLFENGMIDAEGYLKNMGSEDKVSSVKMDAAYQNLKKRQILGGKLSSDENAELKAYEARKMTIPIQIGVSTGEARAKAFTRNRIYPATDLESGSRVYASGGDIIDNPNKFMPLSADVALTEEKGAARQRTGMRSANVQTASTVFDQEMPELIRLRNVVQKKGLLPSGGIKDINKFNQWVGTKVSDPDVAELQKKTKLMADALQRTIGGTQGGQWAFEVAADILDPTYNPKAFERIFKSHSRSLQRMADAYKSFGLQQNGEMDYAFPEGYKPTAKEEKAIADKISKGKLKKVGRFTIEVE